MKKYLTFILLPLLIASITSCSSKNNIVVAKNFDILNKSKPANNESLDSWTISLDGDGIKYLMDANYNFILYIASEGCSSCIRAKPQILNYIYENKTQIYLLNTSEYDDVYTEYAKFYSYTIGELNANLDTPTLLFYSGRTLMNKVIGNSKLLNQNSTNNLFHSATTTKNIYTINSLEDYNNNKARNDSLYFLYNRSNSIAKDIYSSTIKSALNGANKNIYIIELDALSDEEEAIILNEYSLSSSNPFLYYYANSKIEDYVSYNVVSDVESLSTFLNKYCAN